MAQEEVASIFFGGNPFAASLNLLFIQTLVIVILSRCLAWILRRAYQPRVIAEVIGGILLGPSALGKIPGFNDFLFPNHSLHALKMIADIGLIFFLLLMGLELDISLLRSNAKKSIMISLTGIITTLALSCGISSLFYMEFVVPFSFTLQHPVSKLNYMMFIGVAMSVTAFPVLARILTERKLLSTTLGITVISAAAVDDAMGWSFLALTIAIVHATSPLSALYVFISALAFAIFMLTLARWAIAKAIRYTESGTDHGSISQISVTLAFVITLVSAFITDAIGIHAIFGGFLAGLALPREGGFAMKLTEKIEDMVTILFLPLYFAYSGLRTNIGSLDTALGWGCVCLVLAAVAIGKIGGCSIAARMMRMSWRDSICIGVLMNTKGLVELIILNLGLDAGVIDPQTFVIMVLLALITTFMTTPLITIIYRPSEEMMISSHEKNTTDFEKKNSDYSKITIKNNLTSSSPTSSSSSSSLPSSKSLPQTELLTISPLCICIPNGDNLSGLIKLSQWYYPQYQSSSSHQSNSNSNSIFELNLSRELHYILLQPISARLLEAMHVALDPKTVIRSSPSIASFETLASLIQLNLKSDIIVSDPYQWGEDICSKLMLKHHLGLILLPWEPLSMDTNIPRCGIFTDQIEYLLNYCPIRANIGLFVEHEGWMRNQYEFHIMVPFYGGSDDRESLKMALTLYQGSQGHLTILSYKENLSQLDLNLLNSISITDSTITIIQMSMTKTIPMYLTEISLQSSSSFSTPSSSPSPSPTSSYSSSYSQFPDLILCGRHTSASSSHSHKNITVHDSYPNSNENDIHHHHHHHYNHNNKESFSFSVRKKLSHMSSLYSFRGESFKSDSEYCGKDTMMKVSSMKNGNQKLNILGNVADQILMTLMELNKCCSVLVIQSNGSS